MIERLFARQPRNLRRRRVWRHDERPRTDGIRLDVQQLEERLALAINYWQFPFGSAVTSGSTNWATLVVDDGDNTFLKKNATASPSFTFANNDQFTGSTFGGVPGPTALSISELSGSIGQLTSFYITSGTTEVSPGVLPNPPLAKTMPYTVNAGLNGIVPGTFSASMSVTDGDGKSGTIAVLAEPGVGRVNLRFERRTGDCAVPLGTSTLDTVFGSITLRWDKAPTAVALFPLDWANYDVGAAPVSFTLYPGQTPDQRLGIDFQRWAQGSSISIDSPITASLGSTGDPFFRGFGGIAATGQLDFQADTITIRANASSSSIFSSSAVNHTVNRPVSAPIQSHLINATAGNPGRLLVSEQGALANSLTSPASSPSGSLSVTAQHADIVFAGTVNATEQTYLMQSVGDTRAYSLTTISPTTGVQAGRIYGGTVGVTLANDAGGDVDIQTQITNLRMTASSTASSPVLPYAIRVLEADNLLIDAVPASQRAIAITAGGTLTLTSSIQTTGDLALVAKNDLKLSAPISSATGSVVMVSDSVTSNSTVTAGGIRGVTFTSLSATGDVDVNALVRAGGLVKQPVKAATVADTVRSGPQTIDGVALVAGDRVLVKNQTIPSENGIYVVAAGAWTRASDANLSGLFVPGFSVYVTDGTQRGGWAFANPTSPSLNTTGLLFVPVSATQTYAPVAAATTADITLSGLQTIDGVALLDGQRVLVKDQTNRRQNGIYVVVSTGDWQRAGDADTAPELRAGSYVFVEAGGSVNGSKGFVLDEDAVQVGVTQLTFSPFAVQTTRTNTYSPANVLRSAVAATTVNIDLTVAHATIDGQSLATSDLVLVKNQIDAAQNGVYEVQAGGMLARWTGADSAGELARGTNVYVTGGAVNAATSWTYNDTVSLLGSVTIGNQVVSGLASTSRLAIGMLVTGPGIPSGTTITGINSSTSIRLSKPVTLTDPSAALTFMEVSAVVVGTTPIVFTPTGGAVVVTAGRSITSTATTPTSRLQGATAVLSAGRPQSGSANLASTIKANTNVGRLSATSPGAITVDNANAVDLVSVGTSSAGPVTATASGTLTALDVFATGTTGTPGTVTLLSTFGNVVAAGVTSALGDIALTAATGDVQVTKVTSLGSPASAAGNSYVGNVTAQAGSVTITANESPGSTNGNIVIDGRLVADGVGSDIILKTSAGSLAFTSAAFVNAKDQLLINTPQAQVTVAAGAQIAASRLSLTAQLGAAKSPPPALGTYQSLSIDRTDAGDIDYTTTSSLTVEGAVTKDGSIAFTAPDITVAGGILPNGTTKEISLHATAGDVKVDAALTASGAIRLKAPAGKISNSAGLATPLVSSPLSLVVEAATAAFLTTKVTSLDATLSGIGAVLEVTETDSLVIDRVLLSAGGTADLKVGSPAAGGSATVKSIDVGATTGTLKLVANENIVEGGTPAVADIVGNRAELTATTGKIDVDTDVNVLLAAATQKNQTVTIDDLGVSGVELQSVTTNNADITVTAKGTILATSVTTAGKISLTSTEPGADVVVGSLSAVGNTITLAARGSILEATPADPTADIVATTVSLSATDGSIGVHLDASAVAASANTAGSSITIRDDGDLAIGDGASGISGKTVTVTVGGGLTQTRPVTAESLTVIATAGDVLMTDAANDVNMVGIDGGTRNIAFVDVDDLSVSSLVGNLVSLTAGGPLGQTGAVSAVLLDVTNTAGAVTLTDATNDVDWLTIANGDRPVAFTNSGVLGIGGAGITGGNTGGGIGVDIKATTIGVNTPITSGSIGPGNGDIRLTATTGDIWLPQPTSILTAKDDTITLDASNGSIYQTAGAIDCKTLVWFAKTAPAFLGNPPNTYSIVSPNLTGGGDITIIQPGVGTITVAGAVTADGNITILGDDVVITGLVQTNGAGKSVNVTATLGSIAFQSAGQVVNALGSVSLSAANGAITAANAASLTTVTANSLALTATADSALKTAVGSISGGTAGNLSLTEADGISISGLTGNVISLAAGGDVMQTGAIKGSLLAITNTAGAVTLTNTTNDVTWLTITNGNRPVSFTDATSLGIGGSGITGGNTAGGIGVDIRAAVIGVNTPITSGGAGAGNGDVRLTATAGSIWLSASVTAKDDAVILDASNATIIQQSGILDCQTLVWYAASQPTLFGTPPNTYTVIAPNLTAGGNIVIGPVAGPLTVAGASTSNGTITITGGSVVITGLVQTNGTNKSIAVTATSGGITFQNGGQIANALGSVSLTAAGPVAIGTVTAGTSVTVTTTAGGGVDVGPLPNGLLKAGGTLDLRNVQGTIGIRNGGRIEGSPVLLPAGKGIQVGGSVTTAAGLNQTVATINALPVIPGSRYEILVAANISLTQTLTVSRPLALRGTSQAITLFGSAAVRNGLLLDATAGNSRVSDLTFAGFADDAIRLTNNTNSALTGLRIRDSGYGLTVTGTSTGTVAQGNVFNRNATGVRLLSATGVLIGGYAAGQGNTIQNAAREGVFAQGFCTGSQVIKNTITGTAVPYNTTQSRNLTVVR
ncbi:MAG: beta strand repeat-containing protein [Planctomycetia bacterium]